MILETNEESLDDSILKNQRNSALNSEKQKENSPL